MIGKSHHDPRIIPVGGELPPLEPPAERLRKPMPGKASKPKEKTGKRSAGERFRLLNNFVDFTLAELTRAEIAVWMILYRDTRDGTAQTAYDDLARRAGCNRRNVGRAVRRLEQLGLLQVAHQGGLRRGPSRYCVRPLAKDS
jgi:predicted transcriptional regulator